MADTTDISAAPVEAGMAPEHAARPTNLRRDARAAQVGTALLVVGAAAQAVRTLLEPRALAAAATQPGGADTLLHVLNVLGVLALIGTFAGYLTLVTWMDSARDALGTHSRTRPARSRIWFSWAIPLYSLWGPLSAMQSLRQRVTDTSWRPLALWWAPWVAAQVLVVSSVEAEPGNVRVSFTALALVAFSYFWLRRIIAETTATLE